jgi:hypothetical protein
VDKKERDEKLTAVREQIEKLDQIEVDSLSDEDLETVSGGCSVWCCTTVEAADEAPVEEGLAT